MAEVLISKVFRKRKEMDYRPPRKAVAGPTSASSCCCPSAPCDHTDDLTHKTDFLPFQVFASQVLEILISINYCGEAPLKAGSIATDSREIDCHSSLQPVSSILISDSQDKEELNYKSQLALNEFKIHV